jgi:hypothetical protein
VGGSWSVSIGGSLPSLLGQPAVSKAQSRAALEGTTAGGIGGHCNTPGVRFVSWHLHCMSLGIIRSYVSINTYNETYGTY